MLEQLCSYNIYISHIIYGSCMWYLCDDISIFGWQLIRMDSSVHNCGKNNGKVMWNSLIWTENNCLYNDRTPWSAQHNCHQFVFSISLWKRNCSPWDYHWAVLSKRPFTDMGVGHLLVCTKCGRIFCNIS